MRLIVFASLAAASACSSSQAPIDQVSFGQLDLSVPAGWTAPIADTAKASTATWSPSSNNSNHQSLRLTRTRPLPALAKAGQGAIERLLVDAQKTLPRGSDFGIPTRFTTPSGMLGVKIEGSFVPAGQDRTYRRIHAVVIDGAADGSLVHVIYTGTAQDKEPMQIVLDSLRRKDA